MRALIPALLLATAPALAHDDDYHDKAKAPAPTVVVVHEHTNRDAAVAALAGAGLALWLTYRFHKRHHQEPTSTSEACRLTREQEARDRLLRECLAK